MKKYKLKKDFPGSKIGAVWVKAENGFMSPEGRENIKMHEHLFKPFNDWFEDYEEPKEYWAIDTYSIGVDDFKNLNDSVDEFNKSIGNYFESKEEAEKAVEKLKAWKRLEDAGFKFKEWKHTPLMETVDGYKIHIEAYTDKMVAVMKDLDLLFSEVINNARN